MVTVQKGVLVDSYSEGKDRLLTLAQVARILHLHERTVRVSLLKTGELPYSRPGLRYLIKERDLNDYIARHRGNDPGMRRRLQAEQGTQEGGPA